MDHGHLGHTIEDHEALRGFVRQQIATNGPGGAEVSSTVNDPWIHGPTASRNTNAVTVNAWVTNTGTARTRTALTTNPATYRTTKATTVYNNEGLPVAVDNFGDQNAVGDETCLRTNYAGNDTIWMIDRVSVAETYTGTCATPGAVLSRQRTFYDSYVDDSSLGAPPTRGLVVRSDELDRFNGSTPVYVRTATMTYDANGRVVETFDAANNRTATAYHTDAATGLVTSSTVTNALGQTATTHVEPAWGQPVKTVDLNGVVTNITYDGLGRTTNVWLPGRDKATQTPSLKYAYLVRSSGGPTAVTTETLLPTGGSTPKYRKSVVLYDGFVRQRQTQLQATGGGRLITETLHNTRGAVTGRRRPTMTPPARR